VKYVVDLVSILTAPIFGLVGVWIGGFVQARREEDRLDREISMARENRLFDYKRTAYSDFLASYNGFYNSMFPYVWELEGKGRPGASTTLLIRFRRNLLTCGCMGLGAKKAEVLVTALSRWADSSADKRRHREDKLHDAETAFVTALRADLGVEADKLGSGQDPS
jgi:hypothetical protein